jgi:hypothetical protein
MRRRDFVGLRFEASGLLHQQRREVRVVCLTSKIQKRRHLTRQIRPANHMQPPTDIIRASLTPADAISFVNCKSNHRRFHPNQL